MTSPSIAVTRRDDALVFDGVLTRAVVASAWRAALPLLTGATRIDWAPVRSVDSAGLAMLAALARRGDLLSVDDLQAAMPAKTPLLRPLADGVLQTAVVGAGASIGREGAPRLVAAALAASPPALPKKYAGYLRSKGMSMRAGFSAISPKPASVMR